MPLKICPRIEHIFKCRFSQISHNKPHGIAPPLAASLSQVETADDEGTSKGFGFSRGMSFIMAGFVFGAGLSASVPDFHLFKEAHCEGGDLLVVDSHLEDSASHQLHNRVRHFSDWVRRRIFFMYERRIRAYSSPEKVFVYFASIKESKEQYYMTPGDLMRAIIPVMPPSESSTIRGGYLLGEKNPGELHCTPSSFFMLFDMNADGRISFEEYNFIRTLIITSLESFLATFKMFDRNGDGVVDMEEFKRVIQLMRGKNKEKICQSGALLPTRRSLDSSENIKLLKYLFGNDGKKVLQYQDFILFLEDLHKEILRLEFSHYDCKQQGHIPVQDFGSSMVSAASMSNISKYLTRVDALTDEPKFRGVRISEKDFEQFTKLRKQRKLLALSAYAVDGINGFSKRDFQWAASQVCQVDLSDTAVDVIFYIFDNDGDGKLSLTEFLGVQDLREIVSVDPLQPGIVRMIRCMWNCAKENCNPGVHG